MLDEEGRTRLKLKVWLPAWMSTLLVFFLSSNDSINLTVTPSNADCLVSCHRWKTQFAGEPKGTRRETKCERATHESSNGRMAGVCVCVIVCTIKKIILSFFNVHFFS